MLTQTLPRFHQRQSQRRHQPASEVYSWASLICCNCLPGVPTNLCFSNVLMYDLLCSVTKEASWNCCPVGKWDFGWPNLTVVPGQWSLIFSSRINPLFSFEALLLSRTPILQCQSRGPGSWSETWNTTPTHGHIPTTHSSREHPAEMRHMARWIWATMSQNVVVYDLVAIAEGTLALGAGSEWDLELSV